MSSKFWNSPSPPSWPAVSAISISAISSSSKKSSFLLPQIFYPAFVLNILTPAFPLTIFFKFRLLRKIPRAKDMVEARDWCKNFGPSCLKKTQSLITKLFFHYFLLIKTKENNLPISKKGYFLLQNKKYTIKPYVFANSSILFLCFWCIINADISILLLRIEFKSPFFPIFAALNIGCEFSPEEPSSSPSSLSSHSLGPTDGSVDSRSIQNSVPSPFELERFWK